MHFPLIFQEELEEDWINYELANYFVLSINTFTCLSSPINLSVYCGMSKQFRDELRHIMTRYIKDISFRLMIMIVLVIIFYLQEVRCPVQVRRHEAIAEPKPLVLPQHTPVH